MTENSQRRTLTFELDQNIDEYDRKTMTMTNIIFGQIHLLMFVVVVIVIIFLVMFKS